MKLRSLATFALTLASTAAIPTIASAHDRDDYICRDNFRGRADYRVREDFRVRERVAIPSYREEYRDFDTDVSPRDVPSDVLRTVDCERHGRPIEAVQYVRREGKLFYRFRIDDRSADFNIRVAPGGRLLSIADADQYDVGFRSYRR